jgi:hypothetical protein
MHPMQTFSGRAAPRLQGVIFSIEGAPAARASAQKIARSLGATPSHKGHQSPPTTPRVRSSLDTPWLLSSRPRRCSSKSALLAAVPAKPCSH